MKRREFLKGAGVGLAASTAIAAPAIAQSAPELTIPKEGSPRGSRLSAIVTLVRIASPSFRIPTTGLSTCSLHRLVEMNPVATSDHRMVWLDVAVPQK